MNIFGIHWCADETMMVLTAIPFVGVFFSRAHAWLHAKMKHTDH